MSAYRITQHKHTHMHIFGHKVPRTSECKMSRARVYCLRSPAHAHSHFHMLYMCFDVQTAMSRTEKQIFDTCQRKMWWKTASGNWNSFLAEHSHQLELGKTAEIAVRRPARTNRESRDVVHVCLNAYTDVCLRGMHIHTYAHDSCMHTNVLEQYVQ